MLPNDLSLAAMAEALRQSADYRVLRRLVPRPTLLPAIGQETKTAILLDIETTGLDTQKSEIIELGMVKFDYLPDGRITCAPVDMKADVRSAVSHIGQGSLAVIADPRSRVGFTLESGHVALRKSIVRLSNVMEFCYDAKMSPTTASSGRFKERQTQPLRFLD